MKCVFRISSCKVQARGSRLVWRCVKSRLHSSASAFPARASSGDPKHQQKRAEDTCGKFYCEDKPILSACKSLACQWKTVVAGACVMLIGSATLACPAAHASIGDAVAASLRQIAPDWVVVTVLASLPVVELRGAIPIGIAVLGLQPWLVYLCAVLGNTVIVPLLLLLLPPLLRLSEGIPVLYKGLDAFLSRAQKQTEGWDGSDVFWGLAWFVAVPLPGTGAWSGSFIAFVLGMPFATGVLANFAGVCCAGALVTALVCMGWPGLWLAVTVLLVLPLARFLLKSMSKDPR